MNCDCSLITPWSSPFIVTHVQDLSAQANRVQALLSTARADKRKFAMEKDELEKHCVRLQSKDTQWAAKVKRKEQEAKRMQAQLRNHKAIKERGRIGMDLSERLSISENSAGDANRAAGEGGGDAGNGIESRVVSIYQERQETLTAENTELRAMLHELKEEVKGYASEYRKNVHLLVRRSMAFNGRGGNGITDTLADYQVPQIPSDSGPNGEIDVENLQMSHFQMPSDWLLGSYNVAEKLRQRMAELQAHMVQTMEILDSATAAATAAGTEDAGDDDKVSAEKAAGQQRERAEALESALNEARSVISEQDKLIIMAVSSPPAPPLEGEASGRGQSLDMSGAADSEEELREAWAQLRKQQRNVAAERKMLLEAAEAWESERLGIGRTATTAASPPCSGSHCTTPTPSTPHTASLLKMLGLPAPASPWVGMWSPVLAVNTGTK